MINNNPIIRKNSAQSANIKSKKDQDIYDKIKREQKKYNKGRRS